MRKAIFIADAHLKSPEGDEYRDIVKFLNNLKNDNELDAVFILGDFFDFFVGFPHTIFYEHLEIMGLLKDLENQNKSIFYLEGNHDFFLKKLNRYGSKINFIPGHLDLMLDGKFFLSHGDLLYEKDYAHRIMTFLIKNPFTNIFSYLLPPHLVYHFAHFVSRFSREQLREDFNHQMLDGFIKKAMEAGYSGAILGHFHKDDVIKRNIEEKKFTLYLLGSWQLSRSYLLLENGQIRFCTYNQ